MNNNVHTTIHVSSTILVRVFPVESTYPTVNKKPVKYYLYNNKVIQLLFF